MTKNNMAKVAQAASAAQEGKALYRVSLGVVPNKELKREMKALKVRAEDPVVKTMMRAKAFAKWGGSIECCDSMRVSILLVDRFGVRTAYGIPSELMDAPGTLAELSDKPEQMLDWIHVADLVNGDDREKIIRQLKLPMEPTQEYDGTEDDVVRILTRTAGDDVDVVLWDNRELSAALIAAIDEQMHTVGKLSAPKTRYVFEVPDAQAADWLRSLMETLTVQPGSLCLREEGTGTLILGPDDGEAEEVRVPLNGDLPRLTQEKQDHLADYTHRCLDDDVLAEVKTEWNNSLSPENAKFSVNSPAEEWRLLLIFYVPEIVFEGGAKGKHLMGALNALEGLFWPEYREI